MSVGTRSIARGWPLRGRQGLCAAINTVVLVVIALPCSTYAQGVSTCNTDRTISTIVGAGLGAAAAAIPATIVHRHDQTSSHRIVAFSISTGALIGFLAAGRDHPCTTRTDSARLTADSVIAGRSHHAGRGAVAGALIGGVLGAVGGTFYNVGCVNDPCHATRARVGVMLFSASEGAVAGGLLGSLVGWALPSGRQ